MSWLNTGLNIVNTGVNAYGIIKNTNQKAGEGTSVHNTTVVERQLTPEEIKIKQEQHAEWLKNQSFNRAIQMQQQADTRRLITDNFGTKPHNDNTVLYIAGGVIVLALIVTLVKQKR